MLTSDLLARDTGAAIESGEVRRDVASETEQREHVRDLLRSSEELVRAYDLKSEIAMLCFVLSIEAMNVIIDLHAIAMRRPLLAGLLFIAFLAAMVGYLGVVAPIFRRMPARANDYSAVNVFFIADPATSRRRCSYGRWPRRISWLRAHGRSCSTPSCATSSTGGSISGLQRRSPSMRSPCSGGWRAVE